MHEVSRTARGCADRNPSVAARALGDPHPHTDIIESFATLLERRAWTGFAALLDPDVVYEVPRTGDRIQGRDATVRFAAEWTGEWHIEPQVVLADDEHASLLLEWTRGAEHRPASMFFELRGGRITKVIDLCPESSRSTPT